jgi:hypothetical protein
MTSLNKDSTFDRDDLSEMVNTVKTASNKTGRPLTAVPPKDDLEVD